MIDFLEEERLKNKLFGSKVVSTEFGKENLRGEDVLPQAAWNISVDGNLETKPKSQSLRPAWVDEDDQQLRVDLSALKKTRKLRKSQKEAVVSGAQLSNKLRTQFEKIHQTPDWAKVDAAQKGSQGKRQRKRGKEDEDEEEQKRPREDEDGEGDEAGERDERVLAPVISPLADSAPLTLSSLLGAPGIDADASRALPASALPLTSGSINVQYAGQVNRDAPAKAGITAVQFHPNGQLLMTAGLDCALRLYQVDGRDNPKVQSVFFEDTPVRAAAIVPDGRSIIASGRRKNFFSFDMETSAVQRIAWNGFGRTEKSLERMVMPAHSAQAPAEPDTFAFLGNDGHVMLMSLRTLQQIGSVKANHTVEDAKFTPDGRSLVTLNGDGEINVFDLRTRRCLHVAQDAGGLGGQVIEISPDGRYIATGSKSGIVNFYDGPSVMSEHQPKPIRELKNLQTRTTLLRFNHDAAILAMGSAPVQGAFRLVHTASRTVFSNWPTRQTPLAHVSGLAFSPNSGYVVITNSKGKALLYRLAHYSQS